jgi:hypothetical protein
MQLPKAPRVIAGRECTDGFELAFDQACGDWLDAQPGLPVIACGMVGSAQGWREAAYAIRRQTSPPSAPPCKPCAVCAVSTCTSCRV